MSEKLTITNERVDDIPLLLAQLEKLQVASLLDEHFPTHGHWQGLSLGQVTSVWLSFMLSQANHRLSHVQPWAQARLETLATCLGEPVRELDWSDDRLALILDQLSEDEAWTEFEQTLNQHTMRVYDLDTPRVRIDSTTAKGYLQVTEEGLFQLGHSKDHRSDLPQVKINMSVLDPLGMPLTTTVVAGNRADDPLYVPEIKRVQQSVGRRGVTYIGDCKMAALETRAFVAANDDYYLCPLSNVQVNEEDWEQLLEPVHNEQQVLSPVYRCSEATEPEQIAEGYETEVSLKATLEDRTIEWAERRLVVRSLKLAKRQEQALGQRVEQALIATAKLNQRGQGKKRWSNEAELEAAVEGIVARYRVRGLIQWQINTQISERTVRGYRDRPTRVIQERTVQVSAQLNEAALTQTLGRLGWRVYVTNQPVESLSLEQAVWAYRAEYMVERGFGRLKGKPLSLTPMYLDSDQRVTGLIRLLMIGLRVLTLLEFRVRSTLQQQGGKLAGIYAGNPKRATARPTTELMLKAFEGLTLTLVQQTGQLQRHLTSLSQVQQRILDLLDLSSDVYSRVCQHFSKPVLILSEP